MCTASSIKWIFLALNIIILYKALSGFTKISLIEENFSLRTLIGFIVLNIFFLLVSILGCWAAYKEDALLMKASALLVLLIYGLLLEFVIIDNDRSADKSLLEAKWAEESEHPGSMDYMQYAYGCCGKDSPDDFETVLHRPIPSSCYSIDGELYVIGCLSAAEGYVSPHKSAIFHWLIYVLIILTFASACYLTWDFNKRQLTYNPEGTIT